MGKIEILIYYHVLIKKTIMSDNLNTNELIKFNCEECYKKINYLPGVLCHQCIKYIPSVSNNINANELIKFNCNACNRKVNFSPGVLCHQCIKI
jgi:hypothetical protein